MDFFVSSINLKLEAEEEKNRRVADPMLLVPGQNYSMFKNMTEAYFGHQGMYQLRNFEQFQNLEVLWLNNNNLKSLKGLQDNFRLKELYVFDNKLTELETEVFQYLIHLRTFSAYNNSLNNLTGLIKILQKNLYLEKIDLFKNPLANEPQYRSRIFRELKNVKMIDRLNFNERDEQEMKQLNVEKKVRNMKREKRNNSVNLRRVTGINFKTFSKIEEELFARVKLSLGNEELQKILSK